jgi:hypothetical protein
LHPRLFALFALAFVLYIVASIAARGVALEAGVLSLAIAAAASALTPAWLRSTVTPSSGVARVELLGFVLSVALAATLSLQTHTLLGEIVTAALLPTVGLVLIWLAHGVPDRPRGMVRMRWLLPTAALLSAIAGLAGAAAAAPPLWIGGRALIAPHVWWLSPTFALYGCSLVALGLRLGRRALGSDAEALAANLWGTIGTGCALALLALFGWISSRSASPEPRSLALLALAGVACLGGHVFMVTPARVRSASSSIRRLFALGLACAAACFSAWLLTRGSSASAFELLAPVLLVFVLGQLLAARLVQRALSPARGALLEALQEARRSAYGALPGARPRRARRAVRAAAAHVG